jgi:hypothetical protein
VDAFDVAGPLAPAPFPLPALASAAADAPLGAGREALLALLLVGRLAAATSGPEALPPPVRAARAAAARQWLATAALPTPLRTALVRVLESTAADDPRPLAAAMRHAATAAGRWLPPEAGAEWLRLAARLAE